MATQLFLFSNISRTRKGKSIVASPSTYVRLDLKTTGLDPMWDCIIKLTAARYKDGVEVDRFSSLIRHTVDSFTTKLTGITNEMLAKAPAAKKVIKDFSDYLKSDDILIGKDSDINFLYDSFVQYKVAPLSNDFVDISRQGNGQGSSAQGNDSSGQNHRVNENPFFGRYCAFTGRLERYKRSEAMRIVAELGGFIEKNVTKRTDFLILGNNEYGKRWNEGSRNDKGSRKHRKAEGLILAGQNIEMIPENVFYAIVDMVGNSG